MPQRSSRSGFTLIEALIALVISGLVASALISLLVGQSRFYERTDDAIYAEQSLRATFDLMSAELRVAGAPDLVAAEEDSVTVRFDVARAVVCDSVDADEAALFVYDTITNANLPASFVGTAYSGPWESDYDYADGWTGSVSETGSGPRAVCTAAGAPGTGTDDLYLAITGWSGHFADGVPDRGSVVRRYRALTYRFGASSFFTSRTALWRGSQELVGPFEDGAGFSYVMDDGSVETSVSGSDLEDVTAIRVTATAVGDGANRFGVSRSMEFDIPFRN